MSIQRPLSPNSSSVAPSVASVADRKKEIRDYQGLLQALLQALLYYVVDFVASSLCFAEIARRAAESMVAACSWASPGVQGVVSFKKSGAQCNFTSYFVSFCFFQLLLSESIAIIDSLL